MADESLTELYLPSTLPYPIKVVSIDARLQSEVTRGTRLLSYSFVYLPTAPNAQPETRFGTWDAAIEGKLSAWKVKVGDVVSQKKAKERPAVVVLEPCKHGVQLSGLCVLCGKDMTNVDYTGFSDASRASIQMTHSAFGPTVSLEEAQRIERETAHHLLQSRKLSLIVDLDQTIVHATVDPTVGEWIAEGEAWEARQAARGAGPSTTPPPDSTEATKKGEDDECNPNWEALKDVKNFRLGPESFGAPGERTAHKNKGKHKMVEQEGCIYYIKPRPGWKEFLRETAEKYEMHIYTMGTRAYAEQVCKAIDPEGVLFGGRVLSRDESNSLTHKSLQRLFPCDTSMVVIIDDRSDVWQWSPNLLKVIPYEFFVGIGDINSAFLPKIEPLTPTSQVSNTPDTVTTPDKPTSVDTATNLSSDEDGEDAVKLETVALLNQNNAVLDAQLEQRPLAKMQEELREHDGQEDKPEKPAIVSTEKKIEHDSPKRRLPKTPLLKNDDYELQRIAKLLNEVHSRFFDEYDARSLQKSKRKVNKLYDVMRIIPHIRSNVFNGVHILFTSIIPLGTRPEEHESWRMAQMFGAQVSTTLTNDITHVVAATSGTVKVDMARKRGGIKIVWKEWFYDSVALWKRQDEKPYLLQDPPVTLPAPPEQESSPVSPNGEGAGTDPHINSSDLDIDSDEFDQDPVENKPDAGLELASINWDDINNEVEAAMNESDDEDGRSEKSVGMRSGNASEEEWTDTSVSGSVTNSPRLNTRKRQRSVTPSDGGSTGANGNTTDDDSLKSPLAKRKKLARAGSSTLKESVTADQLASVEEDDTISNGTSSAHPSPKPPQDTNDEDDSDEDSTSESDEDDEDDFLTLALGGEIG